MFSHVCLVKIIFFLMFQVIILLLLLYLDNIAKSKVASQSSDFSVDTPASLAANGNISEAAPSAKTAEEINSWWRVDLEEVYLVNTVVLYLVERHSSDGMCLNIYCLKGTINLIMLWMHSLIK